MQEHTREPQYQACLQTRMHKGLATLGLMTNFTWASDPKRLCFVLARYKFVAKMLSGKATVLEIGCADAFGSRIVLQEVKSLTVLDFDPIFIKDVQDRMDPDWPMQVINHDMLAGPVQDQFDAAYSLDVFEHISEEHEDKFLTNICQSLIPEGVLIIGTPSKESQIYASPGSKVGHVNCKTGIDLRTLLSRYFANVFVFSMNDEVVHTGFSPMAHYVFALCCTPKINTGCLPH